MNTNIEKEQDVLTIDNKEQPIDLGQKPQKYEGLTLDEYLRDLNRHFSVKEEISDEKLIDITYNLKNIKNIESVKASTALIEVFQNMEAWQRKMESISLSGSSDYKTATECYYSSKQIFMLSCHELYPGEQPLPNLVPSELMIIQRDLAAVELPETRARLANLNNLDTMAQYIDRNLKSNPVEEIQKLEEMMRNISEGVQLDLMHSLSEKNKQELSSCILVLYKLQTLIDGFKTYDSYKEQKDAQKTEPEEVSEPRTPEEIKADEFVERSTF